MPVTIDRLPDALQPGLEDALEQIIEMAQPRSVILFGSWAEGRAGDESDVDILVVADAERPFHLAARLMPIVRDRLQGRRADVVVITPEEWERLRNIPGQVVHEAARYGVRLYDAA
ncbi:MAG: nucleotidyltransferase domain-containing protein [Armatimonadota bacterium]